MITRRQLIVSTCASIAVGRTGLKVSHAQEQPIDFEQLIFPPIEAIDNPEPFGFNRPNAEEREKAQEVIRTTPKGPKPIDVAESFITRYYANDKKAISQWPPPNSWNPLIVEFFSATSLRVNNDMIAWCAAFVNWCLERSGRTGSRSAASQSFLDERNFKRTDAPKKGDLVIWTCYDNVTGKSLGLGHVAFAKDKPSNGKIQVIGGNQSTERHSSIISDIPFSIEDRSVKRRVGSEYVRCTMKLNTYISIV